MWTMNGLCIVFVVLLLVSTLQVNVVSGKYVYGKGYFGTQKITEVTKFSFRPGDSRVEGNITYFHHARGSLYLFMDTNWAEKFHEEEDCEKVKHAHTRIPIGKVGRIGSGIGVAHGFDPIYDDDKNKYNWRFEWTISHAVRTYGWYFVIADCKGFKNGDEADAEGEDGQFSMASGGHKRRRKLRRNLFEYTINLYNPDGDHLPADEYGLTYLYLCVGAFMSYFFWTTSSEYKRRSGNGLFFGSHGIVKAFSAAYVLQIVAVFLEVLHLWAYSSNGTGIFLFDFFSESFDGITQLIISFSLLCLGNGWTLVDFSRNDAAGTLKQLFNRPTLDDETPTLFILIVVVFVSTILQIINKVQADDFHRFHDFDGISGKFILFERVSMGIMFVISIRGTLKSKEVAGQMQLEGFLQRLMIFGTLWMFAFPVVVFIGNIFAHYLRHRVVTIGVLLVQNVCLTMLAKQTLSSSSWYAKVSEVSSAGMLPGFGGAKGKVY